MNRKFIIVSSICIMIIITIAIFSLNIISPSTSNSQTLDEIRQQVMSIHSSQDRVLSGPTATGQNTQQIQTSSPTFQASSPKTSQVKSTPQKGILSNLIIKEQDSQIPPETLNALIKYQIVIDRPNDLQSKFDQIQTKEIRERLPGLNNVGNWPNSYLQVCQNVTTIQEYLAFLILLDHAEKEFINYYGMDLTTLEGFERGKFIVELGGFDREEIVKLLLEEINTTYEKLDSCTSQLQEKYIR